MRYTKLYFATFLALIFICACTPISKNDATPANTTFMDNNHRFDSLKKAFKCDTITLEKWSASDVTDSTFSISFINAKLLPNEDMIEQISLFKEIARSVKASLNNSKKYNSYQIVFVKSDTINNLPNQVHQFGTVVPEMEL